MPIIEHAISGYCRVLDQARIVFCELEQTQAQTRLTEVDCNYACCPHRDACPIARQIADYAAELIAPSSERNC